MHLDPMQPTEGCPPHHWLIANQHTDEGLVERWSCQRCDATRERTVSRRRPLAARKRYVRGEGEMDSLLGPPDGERVA